MSVGCIRSLPNASTLPSDNQTNPTCAALAVDSRKQRYVSVVFKLLFSATFNFESVSNDSKFFRFQCLSDLHCHSNCGI